MHSTLAAVSLLMNLSFADLFDGVMGNAVVIGMVGGGSVSASACGAVDV